jgi:HEAT repeat protein
VLGWLGAGSVVDRLLELLDLEALQQEALTALTDIGSGHPAELLNAWRRVPAYRKPYLAYALGEAGCREALPQLRKGLVDNDAPLRRMAAHALGRLASPEAIADLVGALSDAEEAVQNAASQALVGLGARFPEETFSALRTSLEERNPRQRKFAVEVLGHIEHPEVPARLGMAMKDADPNVRRVAIKAFKGRVGEQQLGNILLALTDEDSDVRQTAVEILAASGNPDVLEGLQLALKDEDIWVRATAVRAFGRLGGHGVSRQVETLAKDPVGLVSIAALETLFEVLGESACPRFIEALDHPDEEVVSAALNLLARCSQTDWFSEHVEDLINHPSWAVRTHFARFASTLLGEKARPILERRLEVETEDLVRQQIFETLETLPGH